METTGISNNVNVQAEMQALEQKQMAQAADSKREDVQKAIKVEDQAPVASASEQDVAAIEKALDGLDRLMEAYSLGVSFDKDSDTNRQVLKVYDRETQEVVKQFPNEGVMAAIKRLSDYLDTRTGMNKSELTGALFDEKI